MQYLDQTSQYEMNDFNNRRANENYVDGQLSVALSSIILDQNKKREFVKLLRGIDNRVIDISCDIDGSTDIITVTRENTPPHPISETGDGVGNLVRIIFSIFTSIKNETIVIDEPELSLHPQAQRNLSDLIAKESSDKQFVIFTHSPYFINWIHILNGARISRVSLSNQGNSTISTASSSNLTAIKGIVLSDIKNRRMYDTLCKEFFFSEKSVFVEGPEDVHYIDNYIEKTGRNRIPLMGYGCGGASNIVLWLKLARDLSIKAAGIFDGNKYDEYMLCKKEIEKSDYLKAFLLDTKDIRDKYRLDSSGRETNDIESEGIFFKNGDIRPDKKDSFEKLLTEIDIL